MEKSSVDYSMITCFNLELQTIESRMTDNSGEKDIATLNIAKNYLKARLIELNKGSNA